MSRMTYLFWCGLAEEKWSRSVPCGFADLRLLRKVETTQEILESRIRAKRVEPEISLEKVRRLVGDVSQASLANYGD